MNRFEITIEGQEPYIVESEYYDLIEDSANMPAEACSYRKLD
jgi:hypothetical protein